MTTSFSAVDPALGYLYRVRLARLWSLWRARGRTDFIVSLETLDDVAFESTGGAPGDFRPPPAHSPALYVG